MKKPKNIEELLSLQEHYYRIYSQANPEGRRQIRQQLKSLSSRIQQIGLAEAKLIEAICQ